jgi:hypothetical protein
MEIVAFVVAVLMIFLGVAGVAYAVARGCGWLHFRAAIAAYCTLPGTFAGLLWLLNAADASELATGLGYVLGATGLVGAAWWLWQRRPVAETASPAETATWQPAPNRVAGIQAGMGRKVEWTVEEL